MKKLCYVKIHEVRGEVVVSICDADLLGKKFRQGNITIDFSSSFFGGKLMEIDQALMLLETATIASLFGENVISRAIEKGLLSRDAPIRIAGIPHVQLIR